MVRATLESNLATKHDLELIRKDMRINAYTIMAGLAAIIFTMAKFGLLSIR